MTKSFLLTSFDTWKPHQQSNASDDLIRIWCDCNDFDEAVHVLRKLPVDFELAPKKVIEAMNQFYPDVVVCCGMAARRSRLSIESNGKSDDEVIHTSINIRKLVQGLPVTRVSHNAGKFVCNHTYYSILRFIREAKLTTECIFVHVPILTDENQLTIVTDFSTLLTRLGVCVSIKGK